MAGGIISRDRDAREQPGGRADHRSIYLSYRRTNDRELEARGHRLEQRTVVGWLHRIRLHCFWNTWDVEKFRTNCMKGLNEF